jgi:hypothetical protein
MKPMRTYLALTGVMLALAGMPAACDNPYETVRRAPTADAVLAAQDGRGAEVRGVGGGRHVMLKPWPAFEQATPSGLWEEASATAHSPSSTLESFALPRHLGLVQEVIHSVMVYRLIFQSQASCRHATQPIRPGG